MLRAAVIVFLLVLVPADAQAEGRIALLIGNEAYGSEIGRLANPHNDVGLLEQALNGLGFEVVTVHDAGLGALTRAVNAYARRVHAAGPNAVGFFYYSGHGASDGSTNYLIPVDVKSTETGELWDESLRLTEITRKLKSEAGNATHFVVFDACRNTLKLTQPGSRAVVQSKGFVPVAQENGMLIAYATAEGELASDVGAGAGPYAQVLAEEIVKPGIEAVVMFRAVQRRVRAAIRQEPYLGFNALDDVYLAGKDAIPPAPAPTTQSGWSTAEREWQQYGKDTKDIRLLEAFKEKHKTDPVYARLAEARIEELKQADDKKAEAERQATLRQQQEEAKKKLAEAEAHAKEESERKLALIQKQEEDKKRAEELKKQQVAVVVPPKAPEPTPQAKPAMTAPPTRCGDGIEITVGQNERRCFKPGAGKTEHFKDCPTCPEMVVVPAGRFTMGSPESEPERSGDEVRVLVSIATPFAVGKFAVTFDEWDACVADGGCNGYKPSDLGWGHSKNPFINDNWYDAKAYAAWVSHKTGKTYRLLSETEREYVTRAGTTTPFWWGSSITPKQANYDGNYTYAGGGFKGERRQRTIPVDSFEPNPWGLYQVHGNVDEWTEDCWNESNTGNPGDGRARTTGACTQRVVRGGTWLADPRLLRSASRVWRIADYRSYYIGFRLARTLNP
jgi:formylglycine-generating enzyme required for sulfatase activity